MLEGKEVYIGKLKNAVNNEKKKYEDWRAEYFDKRGLIAIYEDTVSKRGKYVIRFQPLEDNAGEECLKTSYGDLFLDYVTGRMCLITKNSKYYFEDVLFKKQYEKSV